jgi:RNA polymerase sigma-70 factor (ECF subfamily)
VDADRVQLDIASLVDAARDGDGAAFTELVRLHQHEVFTLAVRLVADRELAADVAQEALVRAWRALPGFRGDAKFSTWLHRITVNTAWSTRRRWRRHDTEPMDVALETQAADGLAPEDAGIGAGVRGRLIGALNELSPALRSVVVLKDVYGWSHTEIADQLGISVTAAKVRLHRGRKRLRDILAPEFRER